MNNIPFNTATAVLCMIIGVIVIRYAANPILGWMLLLLGVWNAWFVVEWFMESWW